jgi:hypothetical protein
MIKRYHKLININMIEKKLFTVKYDFYSNIKQSSIVRFVTIINDFCLVEDVETKERAWVNRRDIQPINKEDDHYNYWD